MELFAFSSPEQLLSLFWAVRFIILFSTVSYPPNQCSFLHKFLVYIFSMLLNAVGDGPPSSRWRIKLAHSSGENADVSTSKSYSPGK